MTLDDAILALPGLAQFRELSADDLRRLLSRERGECTWCGTVVPKRRQTWCSDACVETFKSRCDSSYQAGIVEKRDRGICALCGRDTLKCLRVFKAYRRFAGAGASEHATEIKAVLGIQYDFMQPFQVDHIKPVVEGGGLCGPAGLRTLCVPCHKDQTAALARRRRKS